MSNYKELPTQDELNALFRYCKETGNLIRKVDVGYKVKAGDIAGYTNHGYTIVAVNNKKNYRAHRIIWVMLNGGIDSKIQIDHINGDKGDNRIENLRLVTWQENFRNQKRRNTNKSGVTGVNWNKKESRWRANITINYKQKSLGSFKDKEEAIKARKAAEIEYGFHENHGRS